MAEVCRLGHQKSDNKLSLPQDDNIRALHVFCIFISLVTILADVTTDILVFIEYCDGHFYWALPTVIFIFVPNIVTNLFSNRWLVSDNQSNMKHWITHIFLVGILDRYISFIHRVFNGQSEPTKRQKLISLQNDLCLLHFLYLFTGTVPQIILQSYAIVTLNENYSTKVFAIAAAIASIFWGFTNYIYSVEIFINKNIQWRTLLFKLIWHFSILLARISSIFLTTIIFGIWTLIPICLHWLAMTFWIIIQKTTFCSNKLEETLYNVVMGFVYCFIYINVKESATKYRLLIFYMIIAAQNFGSLLMYCFISKLEMLLKSWSITATVIIIGGTIIGISAMIVYYKYFQINEPLLWNHQDYELNNSSKKGNITSKDNSFHGNQTVQTKINIEDTSKNESHNADKNFLLSHWIANTGSPTFSSPGTEKMEMSSIEIYTVENTPQSVAITRKDSNSNENSVRNLKKYMLKKVCSPTELTLKLSSLENLESSIDQISAINNQLQKRRGICSSDDLRDNINIPNINLDLLNECFMKTIKTDHGSVISQDTDGSNKKTSSDSIDMDLDLSFSDINSSDINTFNENIVQKLCLSALKNIKVGNQDADIENIQRIALDILKEMYNKKGKSKKFSNETFISKQRDLDTPTELLSVHDYENICAVNIAREAWGLRSWNGYSDIENWLHDGSVVRDRRRDTLTSASSEISSCLSQELKNAILLAPAFPKKAPTYSNVFVKFDSRAYQDDYVNTIMCHSSDDTFIAKPCVIDMSKDSNHLEPILEELDDITDKDFSKKKNSESSLVATIDEIRKATVANSPRNLYHRRNYEWNSPLTKSSESNLKEALWKEPSKFDSSNIKESLPEKENIFTVSHGIKQELSQDVFNGFHPQNSIKQVDIRSSNRNDKKPDFSLDDVNAYNNQINSVQKLQDLSNKDIDFLWQIVSDNSIPHSSTENLTINRNSSSLQSLIHLDDVKTESLSKINNITKGNRSRPRRKFSIIREKFEPRSNLNEQMLCRQIETNAQLHDQIVNIKNKFDGSLENMNNKSLSIESYSVKL
ncbi:hypothetical protein ACJJTC_003161 [Scirpophaga incertulas]